jgi:hypothetical protein
LAISDKAIRIKWSRNEFALRRHHAFLFALVGLWCLLLSANRRICVFAGERTYCCFLRGIFQLSFSSVINFLEQNILNTGPLSTGSAAEKSGDSSLQRYLRDQYHTLRQQIKIGAAPHASQRFDAVQICTRKGDYFEFFTTSYLIELEIFYRELNGGASAFEF